MISTGLTSVSTVLDRLPLRVAGLVTGAFVLVVAEMVGDLALQEDSKTSLVSRPSSPFSLISSMPSARA